VLPLPLELCVVFVDSLASEMLYRAVTLQFLGAWMTDRLYEAAVDDMIAYGGWSASVADLSEGLAVAAVVATSALYVCQQVQRLRPLAAASSRARLPQAQSSAMQSLVWSQVVLGARDLVQLAALSTGFMLTHSIAAVYLAAATNQAMLVGLRRRAKTRAVQVSLRVSCRVA